MFQNINKLVPNEFKGLKRIFFSFNKYIFSLFNIGYESNSDRATITVLVISSILLSIASGYTTFNGLLQYTPSLIAILITLGIQGLLFGVSWRIGKLYIVGEINFVMWGIWAITLLVSVFFSYAALFNTVYSNDERESNRIINSVTLGSTILGEIEIILSDKLENSKENINLKNYNIWKKKVVKTLNNLSNESEEKLLVLEKKYQIYLKKWKYELKNGGSEYINSQGKKALTNPGPGKIANGLKKDANDFKNHILDKYKVKINHINNETKTILENISEFERSQNINYFNISYEKFIKLVNSFNIEYPIEKSILGESFTHLSNTAKHLSEFNQNCPNTILTETSFQSNISNIRKCIRFAKLSETETKNYFIKLNKMQKNEGKHTHFFIIVINQLINLNPLSLATLSLAFIIDVLILLCSLVASKHTTFLNMKEPKDLLQMKNYPLEIILDADTTINPEDTTFIKRIKLILNYAYFELEYAKKGFSMVIEKEKILELKMHKELGTFFSMGLARPVDGGTKIAFKTNFILWLCEQIARHNDSSSSFNELKQTFKGKNDE